MKKYKGFTLVELMIVIVVIGILASMMAVSSSESVSTANASNIISNLRNYSMAAMALYTDKMGEKDNKYVKLPGDASDDPDDITEDVKKYLHNKGKTNEKGIYYVYRKKETKDGKNYQVWWAGYEFGDDEGRVKEKLAGRADNAQLKGTSTSTKTPPTGDGTDFKATDKYVWIKIRSSNRN